MRKLTRLPEAGRVAGVCAGLAAYYEADVTLVRLVWVILSIVPGVLIGGVIAYAAAWLIMPVSLLPPVAAAVPPRRLVRPVSERRVGGVCAGLAKYLDIDPTIVRLLWVVLSIYPGAIIGGALAYVVAWFIIPSDGYTGTVPTVSPV